MQKAILAICCITILASCKQKIHPEYEQTILGDWKLSHLDYRQTCSKTKLFPPPPLGDDVNFSGFSFLKNNVFKNKAGYFNYDNKTTYLGTNSKYKLDGDSLLYFDLLNNKWQGFHIIKISRDSLLIKNRTYSLLKYVRKHYTPDTAFKYDQIAVSYYSFWGMDKSILVSSNGSVITAKLDTSGKRVFLQTNITSDKFNEVKSDFAIAGLSSLKDEYSGGGNDGPESSITFIKNGKIVKSIHDYMYGAPKELIWAYSHLRYIDQSTKQCPLNIGNFALNLFHISFVINTKATLLTTSETFYLCLLINQAKETNHLFLSKFDLNFYNNTISKIKTDGQFYQFTYKDGTKKTYDIGFNFIKRNTSVLQFKEKTARD